MGTEVDLLFSKSRKWYFVVSFGRKLEKCRLSNDAVKSDDLILLIII